MCPGSRGKRAAGLVQHPVADRHDQPALLGHGEELGGREQAAPRMLPADQASAPISRRERSPYIGS